MLHDKGIIEIQSQDSEIVECCPSQLWVRMEYNGEHSNAFSRKWLQGSTCTHPYLAACAAFRSQQWVFHNRFHTGNLGCCYTGFLSSGQHGPTGCQLRVELVRDNKLCLLLEDSSLLPLLCAIVTTPSALHNSLSFFLFLYWDVG